jgi:hypothetical protein
MAVIKSSVKKRALYRKSFQVIKNNDFKLVVSTVKNIDNVNDVNVLEQVKNIMTGFNLGFSVKQTNEWNLIVSKIWYNTRLYMINKIDLADKYLGIINEDVIDVSSFCTFCKLYIDQNTISYAMFYNFIKSYLGKKFPNSRIRSIDVYRYCDNLRKLEIKYSLLMEIIVAFDTISISFIKVFIDWLRLKAMYYGYNLE